MSAADIVTGMVKLVNGFPIDLSVKESKVVNTTANKGYSYGGYQSDSHFRFKLPVSKGTYVYLSSLREYDKNWAAAEKESDAQHIDFGVYLDQGWKKYLTTSDPDVIISHAFPKERKPNNTFLKKWNSIKVQPLPGIYLPWADHGVPTLERLQTLLSWLNTELDGGAAIEIACFGGHGRTGTLAAAIMLSRNAGEIKPQEAINLIRSHYCKSAIESYSQEKMLYELCGMTPPPQVVKTYTPSNKAANSTSVEKQYGMKLTVAERASLRVWYNSRPLERMAFNWAQDTMLRREEVVAHTPESYPQGGFYEYYD